MTLRKALNIINRAIADGVPIDSEINELSDIVYINGNLEEIKVKVSPPGCDANKITYEIKLHYRALENLEDHCAEYAGQYADNPVLQHAT